MEFIPPPYRPLEAFCSALCASKYKASRMSKEPIKRKVPKRRKPTGEAEVFKEIWDEREHICTNCKAHLGDEAKTFHFAHKIPKGREPKLRLVKENIMLHCFECHREYDQGIRDKYNARFDLHKKEE